MNIGYVKIRKKIRQAKTLNDFIYNLKLDLFNVLNIVEQDKFNNQIFYLNNLNSKSKQRLVQKLKELKTDYVIVEGKNDIEYPKLKGKYLIKNMIPEIVDMCYKLLKPTIDEVYVCTNIFNQENVSIIEDLIGKVKVVNVVTNNQNYYRLERRLEQKDIFITVSSNRRKSLKNAYITVNLDFNNFEEYNINRNMLIIDTTGEATVPKSFNGIIVRKITINTKKVLRVLSEFKNFDRNSLIEAEIIKMDGYSKVRNYIKMAKIYIQDMYNIRKIDYSDFNRLKNIQDLKKTKKKPLNHIKS